jgi:putative oxidoreductase
MNDSGTVSRWRSWSPYLLSILRIVAAFLFVQFGTAKVLAFPAEVMPGGGTAGAWTIAWVAGMLEIIGGSLLLVGLFTRPTAFILAGEMAFAYFMGHAGQGFWPVLNQGTPAVIFCFVFLYLSAGGAGPWSLDAMRKAPDRRTVGLP